MSRVVLENLTKIFPVRKSAGVRAVENVSLALEDGELLALVGPSGCGKSTLLRMIAGLEEATSGTVAMDGRVLNKVAARDRDVAMVFQNHALYPHLTARENLEFGLKLRHHAAADIAQRVASATEMLGLVNCLDRRPAELSGGERQRVALGRAIVREPKVFLFDEPLSNLDAQSRTQMRREIAGLHRRLRATMLYVTHDQHEALALGDRVAVMRAGAIEQVATPRALYEQPANMFVAGFVGSPPMNFFRGALEKSGAGTMFRAETSKDGAGFKLAMPDELAVKSNGFGGKKIILGLRPEHIREKIDGDSGNVVDALAETTEPMGAETYLYASSAGQSFAARVRMGKSAGAKVSFAFDLSHAHFFDADTGKSMFAAETKP